VTGRASFVSDAPSHEPDEEDSRLYPYAQSTPRIDVVDGIFGTTARDGWTRGGFFFVGVDFLRFVPILSLEFFG
jgi:hypothetical protein